MPPPHIIIGWGYEGPDASHLIWGGGGVSSDPHPIVKGEEWGGPAFVPPPVLLQGGDMGVLMLPISYGGMWEGVGGSSDPHPIVWGEGERGEGGPAFVAPPPISL